IARAQNSAPKNDAKNITSEKMNQLMLQRKETSTCFEYLPPSLSPIAVPNHWPSVNSQRRMPARKTQAPHSWPFTHWLPPPIMRNSAHATVTGKREGGGTK